MVLILSAGEKILQGGCMDIFQKIAEQRILEAMEKGDFDQLVYQGKPVVPEDLSNVPEELRMCYKILKNAHIIPEELELKKEIVSLQKLLDCCGDETEKTTLTGKINERVLRFNILMDRRKTCGSAAVQYKNSILKKFGL